jgi:hypothetical protein
MRCLSRLVLPACFAARPDLHSYRPPQRFKRPLHQRFPHPFFLACFLVCLAACFSATVATSAAASSKAVPPSSLAQASTTIPKVPEDPGGPVHRAGPVPGSAGAAAADSAGSSSDRTSATLGSVTDSAGSVPDTARALADTAATRAAGRVRRLYSWTRASLPAVAVARGPGGFVIPRETADHSTEAVLREVLEWSGGLRRIPSVAYNAPDPIDAGDLPGREPAAYLLEGMPLAPSGYPEMTPDPVGPLWLEQASLLPADPLLLPSNPSGGPVVALDLLRPDSSRAVSGFRLTSGFAGAHTEEFFVSRPSGSQLTRFGYADSKTYGRFGIDYFRQFGENLLLRTDRGTSWGGWRLGWRQAKTRVRPSRSERYLHDRSAWDGGLALLRHAWAADLSLAMSWERLAWEGSVPASRKEALARGLLRIEGRRTGLRPMLTLQLDRQRRRFKQPAWPEISEDRSDNGPGLAGGFDGVSGSWRFRSSVGWATPAPGKSGWVAAATAERPVSRDWGLRLHADRCIRGALVPRLAGDLAGAVGQGAWVSGSYPGNGRLLVDPERRLETLARVEAALEGAARRTHWTLLARGVRIDHAVAPGHGELSRFTPEGYAFLSAASLDRTVQVASLRGAATIDLGRGLAFEMEGTGRTAKPVVDDQLWMAPWDGRVRLSLRRAFFSGDLRLEGFARGAISGPRSTPYGTIASGDRYDAGVSAQVDELSIFVVLLNLENEYAPAADYEGGISLDPSGSNWWTLPLRTYRMGLTWCFLN